MLAILVIAPLSAHAQWQVNDKDANKVLGQPVKGTTINDNLDAINKKLIIGANNTDNPGPRMEDPSKALPAPDAAEATLDKGERCKAVATAQQATCQAIVDIENAQYKYMLTVYKTSDTRQKMLQKLLDEREAIKDNPNQYGMLESNSNKLMALYNLIALDRQQMESVNYAYEANLRYLRASQAMDAEAAQTGTPRKDLGKLTVPGMGDIDIGSLVNAAITGVTLKAALEVAQSNKPDELHRLSIGKSNGW
ncbi:MAG: hypothetical protein ABWX83_01495 [Luteibacter sp.]